MVLMNRHTIKKILFVCHGNICRSPMAEFMMKKLIKEKGVETDYEIASAATSAEEIGNDIYPPAKQCLLRHGVPFSKRGARQMTAEDYHYYDHIYVMDDNNLRWLRYILPEEITASGEYRYKVRRLMSLCSEERDVADPWYTGDFERTFHDIDKALNAFIKNIEI